MIGLDNTFARLVECALKGERCPISNWERLPHQTKRKPPGPMVKSEHLQMLARQGRILIEISGHNWRTVTILDGPHAGKKTMADPHGHRIWQTIGRETVRDTMVERGERRGPTAPKSYGGRA
jgi:hypothetical protein